MKTVETKLWNFKYIYLLCLSTVVTGSFHMISPIISKYAISMGASLSFAGIIAGIYSVSAMLMRPFAGAAADRFNKKHLMAGSTFGIAFSIFAYFIIQSAPLLFIFRFIHGLFFGISGTTNIVLASQYVPKKQLGEGIGYLGMATVLGTAIGPIIGLSIANKWGIRSSFFVSFCSMLIAATLMLFMKYTPQEPAKQKKEKNSLKEFLTKKLLASEIFPLSILGCLMMMTQGIVASYLVLVGDERNISNIGLYFTVSSIIMLMSRPLAGKISDHYSLSYVLIPAFCCAAAAMFILSWADSLPLILLVALLQAFGVGMAHPALQAESIKKLGQEHSGTATGTYYLGADLGIGGGPMVGGVIATYYGYGTMYGIASIVMILGLLGFLLYRTCEQKHI